MNHIDILKQYLADNDKLISYRWLANELQVSVDIAKNLMNEYIVEYPDINMSAMYCISGIINDTNEYQMLIVPYKQLDNTKKRFASITGTHIYSLQHKLPSNIASQLKNCDSLQAKDLLSLQPTCEFFLLNKLGSVVNRDINIKPIGQKYVMAQMHAESMKDPIKSTIPNPPASKGTKKVSANDFFNSTKASNAATEEKKKAEKLKELDDILDFSSKSDKTKKDNTIKSIGGDDGNDAEWDDGTGYRTSKDNLKKRKAINIPDADDEDESKTQKIDEENEAIVIDEEDEKENKSVVKKTYTHGAMDDYMEDIAIAKHLSNPSGEGEAIVKKTKKKLVQKTVCDEKSGYIETVFEYEEVTDDEEEKPKEKLTVTKTNAPPKVAASKSNKKCSPEKKSNQKSMMSFFGAKK